MEKIFKSNIIMVLILFAAAMLVSVLVYPEIFINFKTSVVMWSDYCVEYAPTFILTTFIYQGGLQLWDFFAQMPYFHTYAVLGLFKFPNVVTSFIYYLLAPFTDDSSGLFHHVFVWGYMMTLLCLRVTGIFLLLKTVTRSRVILALGTVIFAVFFSQMAFMRGTPYMSYFPLGMYLVVRLFQDLQLRYLLAVFFFFLIVLSTELLHGAYLYLPMHFFIISGIIWRVFINPISKDSKTYFWKVWRWRDAAWVLLMAVLMMAPYVYIMKFGLPDLAFGQDNSRIAHPFSPQWYFHNPQLDLGAPGSFFGGTLNVQTVDILYYMGLSFYILSLFGLILSRNKLKWFFALGVLFLWLLSFPREGFNIGLLAHWINVLTNPLKTLPRSYRFTCEAMLPYLLMPLAVLGIEAMVELYRGKKFSGFVLSLIGLGTVILVLNGLPFELRGYSIAAAVLMVAGLAWIHLKNSPRAKNFLVSILCLLVIMDIGLIVYQTKHILIHFCFRKPTILDAAPQAGVIEYDYENPSIFPYRNSYTFHFSYNDELDIWFPHGPSSDVHHVINQALNFSYLNGYMPRHKEFANWMNDPEMQGYLSQNNEFIFLATSAIKASPHALTRITSAGLASQVVEVEDPKGNLQLPDQWPAGLMAKQEDLKYDQITGIIDDSIQPNLYNLQGGMIIYTMYLPSSFPDHLASSWFPAEQRYLRFFVQGDGGQWQELQPAQGELIRPNTFDVQNIKQGQLKAAFSKDDFPLHHKCVLLYPSSENQGVERLWSRQFDNLGIIYRARSDGWLVGHYPYDPKWRIWVDGKQVAYYRVDKSFIGFPLAQGEHKILIQYWPHSPLRFLLLLSAFLTTLALPLLIYLALKWE